MVVAQGFKKQVELVIQNLQRVYEVVGKGEL